MGYCRDHGSMACVRGRSMVWFRGGNMVSLGVVIWLV